MRRTPVIALASLALGLIPFGSGGAKGDFTLNTLASFSGPQRIAPAGTLVRDAQGNIYGTTNAGGANGQGSVFKVAAGGGTATTVVSFNGTNGANPVAGLTADAQGNLYGTTAGGGAYNRGSVFEVAPGTGALSTLASFNGTNGNQPLTGLVIDAQHNLYGTSELVGSSSASEVYKVAAGSGTITSLATFNFANASFSINALALDSRGNLYGANGVTANASGTVFEVVAGTGSITNLATFNGPSPNAGVTLDAAGNIYGAAFGGGANGNGFVYRIAADTGILSTIASFSDVTGSGAGFPLTLDAAGNIFGTTRFGGVNGGGTVFEIGAGTNTFTVLANFNSFNAGSPTGGLILDAQGNLYGATNGGGPVNTGTVFELVNNAAVPEPGSWIILGQATLVGLGLAIRSRSRRRL